MISLAISFCPNDTFAFYSMIQENPFTLTIADLTTLNELAIHKKADVVKVSAALYPEIEQEYVALQSGAALGFEVGPLVVGNQRVDLSSSTVALPGKHATARFLFEFFNPHVKEEIFVRYNEILPLLQRNRIDAGVIIHESRFTFQSAGMVQIQDLGKLWENEFALPLPLGIIVAKRSLGEQTIQHIENQITASIVQAKQHPAKVLDFVQKYSIEKDPSVIEKHIDLYVNEETSRLSPLGKRALNTLWEIISCKN